MRSKYRTSMPIPSLTVLEHHGAGPYVGSFPDPNGPQQSGSGAQQHIVADDGMPCNTLHT